MDIWDLLTDIKDLVAVGAMMLGASVVIGIASCTGEQQTQVRTVLQAADRGAQIGCVLFEHLQIDQEHVEDVCLAAEEVREAIASYKRAKADRPAGSASSPPPAVSASGGAL